MSEEAVVAAFAKHGDWISRFVIDGVAYGGAFDAMNDPRLAAFFCAFPNARTILELGSLEGGHTLGLAQRPTVDRVVGLEGRPSNLARARLIAQLLNVGNVEFHHVDVEAVALKNFGRFDAIFCSGLLYHLPEPWKLLRQFAVVSPCAFFWTHYCPESEADTTVESYRGRMQIEGGMEERLSGLSQYSFWPTLGSLLQMLTDAGFEPIHILNNEAAHSDGPAVAIAAFAAAQPGSSNG